MGPKDPGFDPILEQKIGAVRFAAIVVGDQNYILSFNVAPELSREDILFSLNLVRYAINQKLRTIHYESLIVEAQRIQQSILPQRVPQYAGFDIWGRTVPAEIVSGDFYDFIPISENILGLAMADGSGHGLPAALVVRDIYMGLRMATDRDCRALRRFHRSRDRGDRRSAVSRSRAGTLHQESDRESGRRSEDTPRDFRADGTDSCDRRCNK